MKKEYIFRLVLVLCIAILVYEFGIKAAFLDSNLPSSKKEANWAADKLEKDKGMYDVVVVGDEPDGIAAAISAARSGARTLLVSGATDTGGIISQGLYTELEFIYGQGGEAVSKGFFSELYKLLGKEFTVEKYVDTVSNLLKNEKNLMLVYGAKDITPVLQDNTVVGIKASVNGEEKTFAGKRFIDSTREGLLLAACNVPYSNAEKELNLGEIDVPVRLNFEIEGVTYQDIKTVIDVYKDKFYNKIYEYETDHLNTAIRNFRIYDNGGNKVIIGGVELINFDAADKDSLKAAYKDGVDEAKNFSVFLANNIEVFKGLKFTRAAEKLVMPAVNHYLGEETLGIIDVMENRNFEDKIALGAHPVETMIDGQERYIVGKPVQYGIPLGCIIPQKVENLLMTGGKASYSYLAATSADKISVNITTGQSAGIVAVYSLTRAMTPRQIVKEKDASTTKGIQKLLKKQGVYLPDFKIENKNASVWCYDSVKKLMSLGLIAGGMENDFKFASVSREQDLGYILLNGVYRLSPDNYNYSFDASIRPYLNKKKLTKEKAGEMLLAFHGETGIKQGFYEKACAKQYIDELAQLRLKDKKELNMEDVYYLGAYNIRLYTGKNITY